MNLKGFTLAEVLITLGIIGIVASMTLPSLVGKYRTMIVESRLKKFYTVINQAVKMSEQKNGEFKYWGNSFTAYNDDSIEAWYQQYFGPYLKTTNRVDIKNGRLTVYFTDGSKFQLLNHKAGEINPDDEEVVSAIHLYFYPFANAKTDEIGKDKFTFYIDANVNSKWASIEPYKFQWNGKLETLKKGSFGCFPENKNARHYCTALIQYNNWKIPEDYPYKF